MVFMHIVCFAYCSLEKASNDVETTKGNVKQLQIGLAGTKVVVKKVSKMVVKHDKQIKKNTEKIKEVDQRVDVVEQDLEETKEKVEEIDMKVCKCSCHIQQYFRYILMGHYCLDLIAAPWHWQL